MKLQIFSKILIGILWLSTLIVAICWIFWKNAPFDPEPITVVLGLISTAVTALLNEFDSRLEEEEFSLSYALAYGYVNNFLEPLISQLLKNVPRGQPTPRLYIYLPEKLSELEPKNIDRIIARLRAKNYEDRIVNLEFQEGRARDVLTVRHENNSPVYFDFPNTLLSLNSLIEYKTESRKNRFADSTRERMGAEYIAKFRTVLQQLVERKALREYVHFVDKDLHFEFT
jgi:hypothetical protein